MRLKFDSESGVFTIKPESEAEITKLTGRPRWASPICWSIISTPTSSKQT